MTRKTNTLSQNDRIRLLESDIKAVLDLAIEQFKTLQTLQTGGGLKQQRLFIALSTQTDQRQYFQQAIISYGLGWILVAAGRISKFDNIEIENRPIFEIMNEESWRKESLENLMLLLYACTILFDAWFICKTPSGMHAKRTRHDRITKTDVLSAMVVVESIRKALTI